MAEKIYIKTVKAKESQYGIKLSFKADELIKQIQENTNEKGYINLELKKRKSEDQYKNTHYIEVDTYGSKPNETPY